jgi:hypothetical protein
MLLLTSCNIVKVSTAERFPAQRFEEARQHIARLSERNLNPHSLKLLVYDGNDGECVELSIPFWMARMGMDLSEEDIGGIEIEGVDCDLEELVEKLPAGLLVEVEDYEENETVLIWLE